MGSNKSKISTIDQPVPLVNHFCEPHLIFKKEAVLDPETKCVLYRDVPRMTRAVEYMQALKREYRDLKVEIDSIAPSSWARVVTIKDTSIRVKVLEAIITGLKTGEYPITPRHADDDPRITLIEDDVVDIIRWANGLPPIEKIERKVTLWPADIDLFNQILRIAETDSRRVGGIKISDINNLRYRILGPKWK